MLALNDLSINGGKAFVRAKDGTAAFLWGDSVIKGSGYIKGVGYLPVSGWSTVVSATTPPANELVAASLPGGGAVCLISRIAGEPRLFSAIFRVGGFEDIRIHDQAFHVAGSYNPMVVGDGKGRAIATWYTYDSGTLSHAYFDEFTDGTGWIGPVQQAEGTVAPSAALDSSGRAVLLYPGKSYAVKKSGSWGLFKADAKANTPLVLNGVGQGVAGVGSVSRFAFDTGWADAEEVAPNETAISGIDDQGRVLTIWAEGSSVRYRYFANDQWSAPASVFDGADPIGNLVFSMNPQGEAMAAWITASASGTSAIRAQRFVAGLGWQFVQLVHTRTTPDTEPTWMDMRFDEEGNALMVWLEAGADGADNMFNLRSAIFH